MAVWIGSSGNALVMRSLKISSGAAANCCASTLSTWKLRSGIALLLEPGKELRDLFPGFLAAGEAAPVSANQAHQLVTFIDGHEVVFSRVPHSIDQQRLDVRLHFLQHRVAGQKLLPC